jgi:hypothetical protein
VVEVDRERGRIGLRLAEDPDIAGKSVEELAGVGSGGGGGGGDRGPRRGGATATAAAEAARAVTGTAAAPAARATGILSGASALPNHRITELDSGLRVATEHMSSVRSAALGFFVATGSRDETPDESGLSHFLEHLLFRGTDRFGSAEIDQLFDAMGAELNAAPTRRPPRSTRACSTSISRAPST